MPKKGRTANDKKIGRPLRVFTPEQIDQMQQYALNGCVNNTIASLMDIPIDTLERRFKKVLIKKRAERKNILRIAQNKAVTAGVPSMLIFLGKNDLGQTDKYDTTSGGKPIAAPTIIVHDPRKRDTDGK